MPSRSSSEERFSLRPLLTQAEYAECVELQHETWGRGFTEVVPASMLMISQKVGGVAAGAFTQNGRMAGFVYGITGPRHGRLAHWSHMLAVREEFQGAHLGRRLKTYQRECLLPLGVEVVYWTFDPLVARNAHLNINRLGAQAIEYIPDLYGSETDSDLHSGLGTDRFIVHWEIASPEVAARLADNISPDMTRYQQYPIVNAHGESHPLITAPALRIEVPADIQAVKATDREKAFRWRTVTRHAFLAYLGEGYRVSGFYRHDPSGRCFYVLEHHGPADTRR